MACNMGRMLDRTPATYCYTKEKRLVTNMLVQIHHQRRSRGCAYRKLKQVFIGCIIIWTTNICLESHMDKDGVAAAEWKAVAAGLHGYSSVSPLDD